MTFSVEREHAWCGAPAASLAPALASLRGGIAKRPADGRRDVTGRESPLVGRPVVAWAALPQRASGERGRGCVARCIMRG